MTEQRDLCSQSKLLSADPTLFDRDVNPRTEKALGLQIKAPLRLDSLKMLLQKSFGLCCLSDAKGLISRRFCSCHLELALSLEHFWG